MKMPDTTPLPPLAFQREASEIHQELMRASQAYLATRGDHRFADGRMFAKLLALILLCAGFYALSLQQQHFWAYFGCYVGFIFSAMMLTVNVVHDASHNAVFKRARLNHWLNFFVSMPWGWMPTAGECGMSFSTTPITTSKVTIRTLNPTGCCAKRRSSAARRLCAFSLTIGRSSRR